MPNLAIAASVSPPPAMREGVAGCNRARDRLGALGERVELEHADRAVPDDRAGGLELVGEHRGRLRADVEDQVVGGHVGHGLDGGRRVGVERLRADHVHRDRHLGAAGLHRVDHRLAPRRRGRARPATCRSAGPAASRKVLAMPPPTISRRRSWRALSRMVELGLDLGAGDDRHQRALRVARAPCAQRVDLGRQQRPAQATFANRAMPWVAGLRAVRGAEGIVARRCRTAPPSCAPAPRRSSSRPC